MVLASLPLGERSGRSDVQKPVRDKTPRSLQYRRGVPDRRESAGHSPSCHLAGIEPVDVERTVRPQHLRTGLSARAISLLAFLFSPIALL